jgi:predicted dithiol-disulfide oxidoreductase (DUF899 family)
MSPEPLKPAAELAELYTPVAGESDAYIAARKDLLRAEIEERRIMDRVAKQRRALPPGPVMPAEWKFKDEHGFDASLADLFGEHDTLVVYFWMYGPERERPCPMCTTTLAALNGNARSIKRRVALKILGRSSVGRQYAFAQERGWRDLEFVQTVGDDFANFFRALRPDGSEDPVMATFVRNGEDVRMFWSAQMPAGAADPGQDPRGGPDIQNLWLVLDMTPGGRGTDWYPKLGD